MISRKVLDMSATQDESATLQTVGDWGPGMDSRQSTRAYFQDGGQC